MPPPSRTRPARALCLALLACCAACSSSASSSEERAQRVEMHTELALGYYQLGDLDRAEQQVVKGLELEPDDEALALLLGWTLQRRGRTEDVLRAEQIFRKLQDGGDYRAVLGLGEALEQKGKAQDEAARAIRAGEQDTEAADPAARADELAAAARESWQASARQYARTLELRPEDRDALNGLQRVQALLGRWDESLAASRELLRLAEAESTFWKARLEKDDLSAAEEQRMRGIVTSAAKLWSSTRLQMATVLLKSGRPDEAEAELDLVIAAEPGRYELYGRRAQLRVERGDFAGALSDLDAYLRLTPDAYDHADTRRAYDLRARCEAALAETASGSSGSSTTR
jgi:Tfp pilus assembly protein PilF